MSDDAPVQIRVWAEEQREHAVLLTWAMPDTMMPRDHGSDVRAVAASLSVVPGVVTATAIDDGVQVEYDPALVSRQQLATIVRDTLTQPDDLRTRANALAKRVPTYLSLARALAMDERVSPMPEVARQTANRRALTPLRFVPGFPFISQIAGIIPVLGTLSSWSREASPEVVHEHLDGVGLTRDQIDRDLATARESLEFARAFATDKASAAATRTISALARARVVTRDWMNERVERRDDGR